MCAVDDSTGPEPSPRLLVVDDHVMFAEALADSLSRRGGFDVVGVATSVAAAVRLAERTQPGVVLLDLSLGGDDPYAAIPRLAGLPGHPQVVVLTASHDRRHAARAIAAGASGFLTKDLSLDALVEGIRAVASGRTAISPTMLGEVLRELSQVSHPLLTPRELEVLRLLAAGHAPAEMAPILGISTNTARNHVQRILTKTGSRNRLEAVARAREQGLLD